MSERYITDRFLPDKAIDVIDEAGARARLATQAPPPEVIALKGQLESVNTEKEAAVRDQNFERAASLRDRERELQGDIRRKQEEWEKHRQSHRPVLGENEVSFIVSRWTAFRDALAGSRDRATDADGRGAPRVGGRSGRGDRRFSRSIRRSRAGSRIQIVQSARLSSQARRAWARRSWLALLRSSCSLIRRR
jgi:ATP-dependent Clp protease ATP-binding subunit ClpC